MAKRLEIKKGDYINGIEYIKERPPLVSPSRKTRKALFKCFCGVEFECLIRSVLSGNTSSCGCYGRASRSKRFKKHGMRNTKIYKIWSGIKTRCYNKNRDDYKHYGGRGIVLSEEFKSFECFYDYVSKLERFNDLEEKNLTIDRIDNNKCYERGNLKWSTRKEQAQNRR